MTPDAYRAALAALGLSQMEMGRIVEAGPRTAQRWPSGEARIPGSVEVLLWAMQRDPTLLPALRERVAARNS